MTKFSSISDFYPHIENYDGSYPFIANTNKALVKLSESVDDKTKAIIEWERIILNFTLRKGVADPFWSSTSQDGTVMSYPNLELITKEAFNYLENRCNKVENLWLIAKYNHILWLSKFKNKKFAKIALEAYLTLLKDSSEINSKYNLITNAIILSLESKLYVDEVKTVFRRLVLKDSDFKYYYVIHLISFALNTNKFKKEDFEGCLERIQEINQLLEAEKKYLQIAKNLETSERLAKKTQVSTKPILYDLGKYNELTADEETTKGIAQLLYYAKSLEYFSMIKATAESERVANKIKTIKSEIELPVFTTELEITEIARFYERLRYKMLDATPKDIFITLSQDNPLAFPYFQNLVVDAKKRELNPLDMFTAAYFDINSNISEGDDSEEAKTKKNLYKLYSMQMGLKLQVFLIPLFLEGVKRDLLNYNTFANYISESWLLQKLIQNRSGEKIEYNWWQQLAPGVLEVFRQIEIYTTIERCNFTLAIDSLTLKFEGMFREFANLIGIQTLQPKNKSKKTDIQEVYLEQILSQQKMMELFNESDRMLFTYIFSKNGLDLRNNVAHSFLRPKDYNFHKAILLLLAILRLSKYKLYYPLIKNST